MLRNPFTAWSERMRGWRRPIGPAKPIGAPVRAATVSASARLRSVRPKSFLTLVSFTSWSPRTNTATVSEGVLYSSVLTRRWGVVFKNATTSSTVRAPGVGTFRSGRVVSVEVSAGGERFGTLDVRGIGAFFVVDDRLFPGLR